MSSARNPNTLCYLIHVMKYTKRDITHGIILYTRIICLVFLFCLSSELDNHARFPPNNILLTTFETACAHYFESFYPALIKCSKKIQLIESFRCSIQPSLFNSLCYFKINKYNS